MNVESSRFGAALIRLATLHRHAGLLHEPRAVRAVLANHRGRLETGRSPLGGAEFRIALPRA